MISKVRLDSVCNHGIFQYASSTVQFEVFPHPTWYCTTGVLHAPRVGFSIWLHSCPVKNGCVLLRSILKHGNPAEVIVHQTRTENHRSIKQAQGARPTLLNQMPKGRLESRPTSEDMAGVGHLVPKAIMHTDCSHWRKGRFCSGFRNGGLCPNVQLKERIDSCSTRQTNGSC